MQFSLKRLFVAFTLLTMGLGGCALTFRLVIYEPPASKLPPAWLVLTYFYASGPLIMAGVLHPFKMTTVGLLLGIPLTFALCVALALVGDD